MGKTLGYLEAGWFAGCVGCWLVISLATGESEAACDAQAGWACFTVGDMLLLVGGLMAIVWVVGAIVIGVIYAIVRSARNRRVRSALSE